MKRITGIVLAAAILISLFAAGVAPVSAATEMKVSDALIEILKQDEGFCKYPVYDYAQYTVGYGSKCPNDMLDYYKKNGITEAEAELLLRNYVSNTEFYVNKYLVKGKGLNLTQGQFDALVSFTYNMGWAWLRDDDSYIMQQIVSGNLGNDMIDAMIRWCHASGSILPGLVRRRLTEANMYINGVYSRKVPANYCYVYYNGNGGRISHDIQGFNSDTPPAPNAVATYADYTFAGWYTSPVGGEQVTKLDSSYNKVTLYAQWKELQKINEEAVANPVQVKVTVDSLNVRKGPGTGYACVGSVEKDEVVTVTAVAQVGDTLWGQITEGWISLMYTDYEQVTGGGSNEEGGEENQDPTEPEATEPETTEPETTEPETTEPETTEPETTEPETTEPETTEPETTEPETTEPETTEPETTEPETTEPETTEPETTEPETTEPETTEPEPTEPETTAPAKPEAQVGTVISNAALNVRTGPGTAYAIVKELKPGTRVTILETKTIGSMIWGKTSDGWVSMTYIKLDSAQQENGNGNTGSTGNTGSNNQTSSSITGKVTCASLNVRSGPGVNYSYVGSYSKGATVTVTQQKTVGSTTWGKTSKGWVSMAYIKLDETTSGGTNTTTPSDTTKTGKVISDDVLRVRTGPGTSYAVAGYVNPGDTVQITETKVVGAYTWGKTTKGWVRMDYVKLNETASGNTGSGSTGGNTSTETTKRTGTIKVDGFLNVRSGAGTSYSVKGYYYNGDKVTITEQKKVDSYTWGKTEKGWVRMDYVTLDPVLDENGDEVFIVTKTVNTTILNVRSGAGTEYDIVGYFYEGATVEITEIKVVDGNAWGKTSKGWISMAYLK